MVKMIKTRVPEKKRDQMEENENVWRECFVWGPKITKSRRNTVVNIDHGDQHAFHMLDPNARGALTCSACIPRNSKVSFLNPIIFYMILFQPKSVENLPKIPIIKRVVDSPKGYKMG